jgi:hypothetical protein
MRCGRSGDKGKGEELPDTRTAEQANFSTTGVGGKQVDNLDTGLQYLSGS